MHITCLSSNGLHILYTWQISAENKSSNLEGQIVFNAMHIACLISNGLHLLYTWQISAENTGSKIQSRPKRLKCHAHCMFRFQKLAGIVHIRDFSCNQSSKIQGQNALNAMHCMFKFQKHADTFQIREATCKKYLQYRFFILFSSVHTSNYRLLKEERE